MIQRTPFGDCYCVFAGTLLRVEIHWVAVKELKVK